MSEHLVTLFPGDGDGPAVIADARRVLEATGVPFRFDEVPAPGRATPGDPGWDRLLRAIGETGVALKGPLSTPGDHASGNVALRHDLDLYAGVRPIRSFPGVPSRYEGVDLVVIRENTEDMYVGVEFPRGLDTTRELVGFVAGATGHALGEDVGLSLKANSVGASERIARFAFRYAEENGRRTVTCGHKANIMKFSDGLFLAAARDVAAEHPSIAFEDRIIDALSMQLVQAPERFDVLLLPNLYGDLVSDLAAGIVGGAGLAPAGNIGDGVAVFEASGAPGSGAGGLPVALFLASAMLLRHVGEPEAADRVEMAVGRVLAAGGGGVPGSAGDAATLAEAVLSALQA